MFESFFLKTCSLLMVLAPLAMADIAVLERNVPLKAQAEVWSQAVCLNNIIDDGMIRSRCAIESRECCRWSMGGARTKTFSKQELARDLAKVSLGGVKLNLEGAAEVTITQVGRDLSESEIGNRIAANIAAKLSEDVKNVTLRDFHLQAPTHVAFAEENDWDVLLPEPIQENILGRIVSLHDNHVLGWVRTNVAVSGQAYVAKKMISPSEIVKLEDFSIQKVNVLPLQSQGRTTYKEDQFPIGVRTRRAILAGQLLTSDAIERMPLVKLGDTVTLILRSDSLKVSTKGVAQSSAAVGDMVSVQVSRYNRTFRGRLVDGKIVEVWL